MGGTYYDDENGDVMFQDDDGTIEGPSGPVNYPVGDLAFEEIEKAIDSHGLAEVLDAIVEICHAKAEHLRSNWQDDGQARIWERNAKALDRVNIQDPY